MLGYYHMKDRLNILVCTKFHSDHKLKLTIHLRIHEHLSNTSATYTIVYYPSVPV